MYGKSQEIQECKENIIYGFIYIVKTYFNLKALELFLFLSLIKWALKVIWTSFKLN